MHVEAGIDATTAERRIEVVGTRATAVLAGGWDEVVTITGHSDDEAEVEQVRAVGELPLLAELRAFLAHLDGGPPPVTSAADATRAVELIAEIRTLAGATTRH
jgi:predicted dehydrogenase